MRSATHENRWFTQCVKSSVVAIQICAALYLTLSASILILGIGVVAIWQGLLGLIAAMEGLHGASEGDPFRVSIFMLAVVANFVMSIFVAFNSIQSKGETECKAQVSYSQSYSSSGSSVGGGSVQNLTFSGFIIDCSLSYLLYGWIQLACAIASAGIFFFTFFAWLSLRRSLESRSSEATFLLST
jgi:hypothetical protein